MSRYRGWRVQWDKQALIVAARHRDDAIGVVHGLLRLVHKPENIGPLFAKRLPNYDWLASQSQSKSIIRTPGGFVSHRCPGASCHVCRSENPESISENPANGNRTYRHEGQ